VCNRVLPTKISGRDSTNALNTSARMDGYSCIGLSYIGLSTFFSSSSKDSLDGEAAISTSSSSSSFIPYRDGLIITHHVVYPLVVPKSREMGSMESTICGSSHIIIHIGITCSPCGTSFPTFCMMKYIEVGGIPYRIPNYLNTSLR